MWIAPALLACAAGLGPAVELSARPDEVDGAIIGAKVLAILDGNQEHAEKRAALAELGQGEIDALLAALGKVPAGSDDADLILSALLLHERSTLVARIEALLAAEAGLETRKGILVLVAAHGDREALRYAIEAAVFQDENGYQEVRLVGPFGDCLEAVLTRHPATFGDLGWMLDGASSEIAGAAVRAVAEVGGHTAVTTLLELLGKVEGLDATILGNLGRAARNSFRTVETPYLLALHSALRSEDSNVLRSGLQAVGQLADHTAIELCIEQLRSDDPQVKNAAHLALRQITGLELPPIHDRWRLWYEADLKWLERESSGVFGMLYHGEPRMQLRAIEELLRHRLDRPRLAGEIAQLLESPHREVRLAALQAVNRLGSRTVTPQLIERLSDSDAIIAELALMTLQQWVGEDLPADSPRWFELLASN